MTQLVVHSHQVRSRTSRRVRLVAAASAAAVAAALFTVSPPADAADRSKAATGSTARGTGGAVSSVDVNASRVGRAVLASGGNAADAAVAMASALGVAEPYSAGIGGGGYFVYYDAKKDRVSTIDGESNWLEGASLIALYAIIAVAFWWG